MIAISGAVATVTLDRPARRNAMSTEMVEQAYDILTGLANRDDVRLVVFTGSGDRFFCPGADLQGGPAGARTPGLWTYQVPVILHEMPQVTIAAVNGAAAGGGNELVIACDLAVASSKATFGQTGPRVGSAPVLGGTNIMPIQIGEKRAKELSFLCRRYTAAQALEMGLVNAVVEPEELESTVEEWAAELLALSPRYLEITKISSNIWWNAARDSFLTGLGMLTQAVGSDDMVEGAEAFMAKRKPDFPDPA